MVDNLQVIAQRFAAHGEAVFDQLRGLPERERVAFDSVRGVGQIDVIGFLQGKQRRPRDRAHRVEPRLLRGDRGEKLIHALLEIPRGNGLDNAARDALASM
jgi:hypothetical protein